MLIHGAESLQLAEHYQKWLREHPVAAMPKLAEVLDGEATALIKQKACCQCAQAARRTVNPDPNPARLQVYTLDEVKATAGQDPALIICKGVVTEVNGMMARRSGGQDKTLNECLRVRVIDSLDEMGEDHKVSNHYGIMSNDGFLCISSGFRWDRLTHYVITYKEWLNITLAEAIIKSRQPGSMSKIVGMTKDYATYDW